MTTVQGYRRTHQIKRRKLVTLPELKLPDNVKITKKRFRKNESKTPTAGIKLRELQMNKHMIFSFIPCVESSMVASTKVARFINDQLQIPLVWDETIGEHDNLDVLIIINGAYSFCNHLEPLSHAILGARRIVWVQQDYTIVPPINNGQATSPFRKAFVSRKEQGKSHLEFWTTCLNESKLTKLSSYINWNCLSMTAAPVNNVNRSNELVYYGSYRKDRKKHFDQYFKFPKVPTVISCPNSKFKNEYPDKLITHYSKINTDLILWLTQFGAGLFLEDRKSHNEFHSPPNRFYEMLSAKLPMMIDSSCCSTLWKAGYKELDAFTVESQLELQRKMDVREIIGLKQHSQWFELATKEKENLHIVMKQAWQKIKEQS
jgi:hypothetical protein